MSNQKSLICDVCHERNYNPKLGVGKDRLMIKKFCRKCNKHTLHKEEK